MLYGYHQLLPRARRAESLLNASMLRRPTGGGMDVVYTRCCGIDIHKKIAVACVIVSRTKGPASKEIRTFGTMTDDLLALADWLVGGGGSHACRDGEHWRLLEGALQPAGGAVRGPACQRPAHQNCARPQDRREGCGVDCGSAATWTAEGEFRPGSAAA